MSRLRESRYCRRLIIRTVLLLVALILVLPVIPYLPFYASRHSAHAAEQRATNPRANYWRAVREGTPGYTAVVGQETNVLINNGGDNWRQFRARLLIPIGVYLLAGVLVVIAFFYLIRGRVRIPGGRSGTKMLRFTVYQRLVHWLAFSLFAVLALTGLILLYGRFVLIPLLGPEGFALTASACKEAHNLFGPLFLLATVALFVTYVRDNFYAKGDLQWLLRGGVSFRAHVHAGRFNLGEKIWFWLACMLGIAVSTSGLVLDFAVFGQARDTMELAHVVHSTVALLFIAISFGHTYLATLGVEGTMESMTSGLVDANWARAHHDRWYAEMKTEPRSEPGEAGGSEAQPHRA
jgi:formate dehydrogenase subunit gamma